MNTKHSTGSKFEVSPQARSTQTRAVEQCTAQLAPNCPLCSLKNANQSQKHHPDTSEAGHAATHYHQDKQRAYWHCPVCDLVFVPEQYHLNFSEQKKLYDQHNNHAHDPGYQRFLSRLTDHLIPKLHTGATGLDFGCGPGPVLAAMLTQAGFHMDIYDPIYAPETHALRTDYDFITATEVIEHFCQPGDAIQSVWQRLKPGGWLGIMTKRVRSPEAFKTWHYIRDVTHVSFFSEHCFKWLALELKARLELPADDVALLQKPDSKSLEITR